MTTTPELGPNPQRPAAATLDWKAGTIAVGKTRTGKTAAVRIHAQHRGAVHGMIHGSTGTGISTLTRHLITAEAASGHVDPWLADVVGDLGDLADQHTGYYAPGIEEAAAMMRTLDRVLALRTLDAYTDQDGRWTPDSPLPLLSVTVVGWDILSSEVHEVIAIAERVAMLGRRVGIALRTVSHSPALDAIRSAMLRQALTGGTVVELPNREPQRISALSPAGEDAPRLPIRSGLAYVTGTGAEVVQLWQPEDPADRPAAVLPSAIRAEDQAEHLGEAYLGWHGRLADRRAGKAVDVPKD
ncbi:hypothetical protein ABZW10_33005 [Kitasatospora sp. NPDC004723]|uniref:hypothetical protein n=1 Tax=Kitasatospora sp. NPDC004723 TaxID=3154288 RepID=UPI0033A68513